MKIDFVLTQELYYILTILDQERYRDKRQHTADDDSLHYIVDDFYPDQDGEYLFEHDDEHPFAYIGLSGV